MRGVSCCVLPFFSFLFITTSGAQLVWSGHGRVEAGNLSGTHLRYWRAGVECVRKAANWNESES